MKRRDFIKKSFYMGASSAIGSIIITDLVWKPYKLNAQVPPDNKIIRAHCGSVQDWSYSVSDSNIFHDHINLPVVEDMLNEAVCALTTEGNIVDAWQDVLNYEDGQTIAIKVNLNWMEGYQDNWQNRPNQSSQIAIAVVRSLETMGVPLTRIKVYDVSRNTWSRLRNGLDAEGYGEVEYVNLDSDGTIWDDSATMDFGGLIKRYPTVLTNANHLINIALLKGHGDYVTGALKNHIGTIEGDEPDRIPRQFMHDNRHVRIPLVCTSSHIANKTKLNIIEGFFMNPEDEKNPYTSCENTDFFPAGISGYPSPNSLFVAKNMVVTDSLVHDFVLRERLTRGVGGLSYTFLENAQSYGLGNYEFGTPVENDMQYSQIAYSKVEMPLMTRTEVDRTLRKYKQGQISERQLHSKVLRLELSL